LTQFHFHWANKATGSGSEHQLNGKQSFAEVSYPLYMLSWSPCN